MLETNSPVTTTTSTVRDRILETAYQLFSRRGIRDVGIDEIIERSGVAKATLYRHFASKDDLVVAFLEQREQRWTVAVVDEEAARREASPDGRLLAIFDIFHEWFQREDYEACSFINTLLEMRVEHPAGKAAIHHLANIRVFLGRLAGEAGLQDPKSFAQAFHILMQGSIVSAAQGNRDAAQPAKEMARTLIDRHR